MVWEESMIYAYFIGLMVFLIFLDTPKKSLISADRMFVVLASAVWPITLIVIILMAIHLWREDKIEGARKTSGRRG